MELIAVGQGSLDGRRSRSGRPPVIGRMPRVRLGTVGRADGFLNAALMRSVQETLGSELERREEAVVSYLSLLVAGLASPGGLNRYERYVALTEEELVRRIPKGIGRRERLLLYQTNADFQLLSLGLFDRPLVSRAGRGQGRDKLRKTMECRGTHLYRMAAIQAEALFGREGELTQVLASLSSQYARYCRVLRILSGEKLNLVPRLTPGLEFHLVKVAHGTDRAGLARRRWDHLLDAFNAWRRRGTAVSHDRVERAAGLVAEVDRAFSLVHFEERWSSAKDSHPEFPPAADSPVRGSGEA